jgi:hypothetical protein
MKVQQFRTGSAEYILRIHDAHPGRPFTIFLHGGPGFNTQVERQLLGPLLQAGLNFIWFDLIGTPATWRPS